MVKLIIATVLLSLFGCSVPLQVQTVSSFSHVTVLVDSSFSVADQAEINDSISEWDKNLGGLGVHLTMEIVSHRELIDLLPDTNKWRILHQVSTITDPVEGVCPVFVDGKHLGNTWVHGNIQTSCLSPEEVKSSTHPGRLRMVATHEMGHALGLVHELGGVMAPRLEQCMAHVSNHDVEQFKGVYELPL